MVAIFRKTVIDFIKIENWPPHRPEPNTIDYFVWFGVGEKSGGWNKNPQCCRSAGKNCCCSGGISAKLNWHIFLYRSGMFSLYPACGRVVTRGVAGTRWEAFSLSLHGGNTSIHLFGGRFIFILFFHNCTFFDCHFEPQQYTFHIISGFPIFDNNSS